MTRHPRRLGMAAVAAIVVWGFSAGAQQTPASPEARLGAALHEEQVAGNLEGAISMYSALADDLSVPRAVAARALLQLAGCYERLGRPEARPTYLRIANEYGDTGAVVVAARTKLAALQAAAASPFRQRSLNAYFANVERHAPSPDGRLVAYLRAKPGASAVRFGVEEPIQLLCVRDLSGGSERVLLEPKPGQAIVGAPFWSPDGRNILIRFRESEESDELRLVTVPGGDVRVVDRRPSDVPFSGVWWSPDSRHVAFTTREPAGAPGPDRTNVIRVFTLASGVAKRAGSTAIRFPAVEWSPDSQRLAFLPGDDGQPDAEIATVNIVTGGRQTISVPRPPPEGTLFLTDWLPNDLIAYRVNVPQASNDRFVVPAAGGDVKKICEGRGGFGGDGCQSITADGRYQIVRLNVSGGGRIAFRDLDTGEERTLTNDAVVEQVIALPTQDRKLMAFRSDRDGRMAVYVAPVDRLPVERPVWITDLESSAASAIGWWTQDGLLLRVQSVQVNIYRLDVDPATGRPVGHVRRLTQDTPRNDHPSPSPDGRRIAYVSRDGGKVGISIMDANGANERLVFRSPPDLMPVGQNLGWRSETEIVLFLTGGSSSVSLLNLTTGERTTSNQPPIVGAGKEYLPATDEITHWAGTGLIKARSVATGSERVVLDLNSNETVFFSVSPDGKTVVYTTANWDVGQGKPIPGEIRVRRSDQTDSRALATYADTEGDNHTVESVSPSGRYLAYQDSKLVVHVMDLETAESWPLMSNAPAGIDFEFTDVAWAPDGSYVVFPGWQRRTEWRLFEGVTYDAVVREMEGRGRR